MAEDVAPELYSKIAREFNNRFYNDPIIADIKKRVQAGTATYAEASLYAARAGEICSEVLRQYLTADTLPDGTLYYNIAKRTIGPALTNVHDLVDETCRQIQATMNERAGIGIEAQSVPVDEDRTHGIVSAAVDAETPEDAHKILGGSIVNYARHVADESVRVNADFQYNAGLSPKVVRTAAGKCCDWCAALAGTYDYESVKKTGSDVWRRHLYCDCLIEFVPEKGRRVLVQNYRTKAEQDAQREKYERAAAKMLTDDRDADKIAARKAFVTQDDRSPQKTAERKALGRDYSNAVFSGSKSLA